MHRFLSRVALVLVGVLTLTAATKLPAGADPADRGGGWGQQAVEWCRDGRVDGSKSFGQCVSTRVHELKGAGGGRGHGPKAKAGQQGAKGQAHGPGKKKNK